MFERQVLVFLLLRLVSTLAQSTIPPTSQTTDETKTLSGTPPTHAPRGPEMDHVFTGPVTAVVIYAVVCGIIGVILLIAFVIKVVKKKSFNVQPTTSGDPGSPLNSVESQNPEK
ncbi:glycophorin-A-like isoform X2 [Tachyglossus aculeatus]|uniref:glycophorin-A-like isoform X2 n=1 Tax=Tachyglossus aculeatus TaxID=9261 RepID=UPI0018F59CF1|nr:glycophorin-A-like isoform X2 [Tachyglossus aculeatus]